MGVRKTALYYYYPSKAALYEAVLLRILEELDGSPIGRLPTSPQPAVRAVSWRWGFAAATSRT